MSERIILLNKEGLYNFSEEILLASMDKAKIIVNGATIKFEIHQFSGDKRAGKWNPEGYKITVENVEGPIGIIEEI